MVGNRFKTELEVDPGAEFQDGASDGSFRGKPWCLGLSLGSPGRWGQKGQADMAAQAWLLEMQVRDCSTIFNQPCSPSCKGFRGCVL